MSLTVFLCGFILLLPRLAVTLGDGQCRAWCAEEVGPVCVRSVGGAQPQLGGAASLPQSARRRADEAQRSGVPGPGIRTSSDTTTERRAGRQAAAGRPGPAPRPTTSVPFILRLFFPNMEPAGCWLLLAAAHFILFGHQGKSSRLSRFAARSAWRGARGSVRTCSR